jgi:hypothetical protein
MSMLTADDARAFLAKINEGRKAFGLEPFEKLPWSLYENARPGDSTGCLSYQALMKDVGGSVGGSMMSLHDEDTATTLAQAWDRELVNNGVEIPETVLTMTRRFDGLYDEGGEKGTDTDPVLNALKEADLIDWEA